MIGWRHGWRHSGWIELASALADGELPPREQVRFEHHLAGCARCQTALGAASEVRNLLRAMPEAAAPRSFALSPSRLEPSSLQLRSRGLTLGVRVTQGAAAVALLALATIAGLDLSSHSAPHTTPFAPTSAAPAKVGGNLKTLGERQHALLSPATAGPAGATASPRSSQAAEKEANLRDVAPPVQPAPSVAASPIFESQGRSGETAFTSSSDWYRPSEIGLGVAVVILALPSVALSVRRRRITQ